MTDEEKAARAAELDKAIKAHDAAKAKADAETPAGNLDKVLTCLDSVAKGIDVLTERMDLMEAKEKTDAAAKAKPKAEAEDEDEKARLAKLTPAEREAEEAKRKALEDDEELNRKPGEPAPTAADAAKRRAGRLIDAQLRADSVAHVFGEKAPPPMAGEAPRAYRRRLLREYQHHSGQFKDVDLGTIADPKVFDGIEAAIYADAVKAGATPLAPAGQLREIRRQDETGRTHVTFVGEPATWMRAFAANRRRVVAIRNQ